MLPLASWTLRWSGDEYDRRVILRAALIGAATFQAPWDLLVRWLFGLPIKVG